MTLSNNNLVIAVPKGRILSELIPLLEKVNCIPEKSFFDEDSRQLFFSSNHKDVSFIRARAFDIATYVAFGVAHMGVAGNDVLLEFEYPEVYTPLDLKIGRCRMALAAPSSVAKEEDFWQVSHVRVATKYVNVTKQFFSRYGIQAECIKLSGAIELAPRLGLSHRIVDLVSSGSTLKANNLIEVEKIADISARLVINRSAFKTRCEQIGLWTERFEEAVNG